MIIKKIKIKKLALILIIFFLISDISASYLYYNFCKIFVSEQKCHLADVAVIFFAGFDKEFNLDTLQKARLNKAIELYKSKDVSNIICVGGNRQNQNLYGSKMSSNYLVSNGVPTYSIFYDTLSFDTRTNLKEAHNIIKINNFNKVIYVSDAMHLHRISKFSNYSNYCLCDIDYNFNFFEIIQISNLSFISFILEFLLSEEDYIKFIHSWRK